MFRIVTVTCMVALLLIMPMGRSVWNILALAVSLVAMGLIVKVSIKKERIQTGATAITLLLLLLFPLSFFSAGGFYSGVPEWFVFCFIYVCLTLKGRCMAVFFVLCIAETLLCYAVAFYFPELTAQSTQQSSFFDSAFSVVMVGFLTSILLMFLNQMYEKENELSRQQKKEIEELNRAENHFFSSMSHEIRTPINTIIGLNEIILRGDISEEVAENARNIQGASKLLLTLINDTLDLSKIKSGKMEIVNVSYETGALFSEIVNMIWIKAREKGLEFKIHVDPSIPSIIFHGVVFQPIQDSKNLVQPGLCILFFLLGIVKLSQLLLQAVFLSHERCGPLLIKIFHCIGGYSLEHGFELCVNFCYPYLDIQAVILTIIVFQTHTDVDFQGAQHIGTLFRRSHNGCHDGLLQHTFFHRW